jgi:hypothetical protein
MLCLRIRHAFNVRLKLSIVLQPEARTADAAGGVFMV